MSKELVRNALLSLFNKNDVEEARKEYIELIKNRVYEYGLRGFKRRGVLLGLPERKLDYLTVGYLEKSLKELDPMLENKLLNEKEKIIYSEVIKSLNNLTSLVEVLSSHLDKFVEQYVELVSESCVNEENEFVVVDGDGKELSLEVLRKLFIERFPAKSVSLYYFPLTIGNFVDAAVESNTSFYRWFRNVMEVEVNDGSFVISDFDDYWKFLSSASKKQFLFVGIFSLREAYISVIKEILDKGGVAFVGGFVSEYAKDDKLLELYKMINKKKGKGFVYNYIDKHLGGDLYLKKVVDISYNILEQVETPVFGFLRDVMNKKRWLNLFNAYNVEVLYDDYPFFAVKLSKRNLKEVKD